MVSGESNEVLACEQERKVGHQRKEKNVMLILEKAPLGERSSAEERRNYNTGVFPMEHFSEQLLPP
jgi:hypothetical protein